MDFSFDEEVDQIFLDDLAGAVIEEEEIDPEL